ncbi:MAG: hypothetical protein BMS9Abin31_0148 [Gammaproteobacteria bacterium]|nr:MAG: hypothetical protein BMS9Abin31_0148 [Gammaproteobacteria bacterium]
MLKTISIIPIITLLSSCTTSLCLETKPQIPLPLALKTPDFVATDISCASVEVREVLLTGVALCMDRVKELRRKIEKANAID